MLNPPPWFCPSCLCQPFSSLNNSDLNKLFFDNHIERHTRKLIKSINFDKKCTVCCRKINNNHVSKALPCLTCKSLIHRKCSGLTNYELNTTRANQLRQWECHQCRHEKFPFMDTPDEDFIANTFNSNFDCRCNIDCKSETFKKNFTLSLARYKQDDDGDGPDPNCHIDKAFEMNVDFDYYTAHGFHKLVKKNPKRVPLSIYHTNISSLNYNFENLHTALVDLDYPFDVIALSETWNSEEKKRQIYTW